MTNMDLIPLEVDFNRTFSQAGETPYMAYLAGVAHAHYFPAYAGDLMAAVVSEPGCDEEALKAEIEDYVHSRYELLREEDTVGGN